MNWKLFLTLIVVLFLVSAGSFLLYKNKTETNNNSVKKSEIKNDNLPDDELKKEIGQMIMIGFRGLEISENSAIQKIIKDVKIGGVVLFDYDTPSKKFSRNIVNPEQTKKLILDIQKYSEMPLFIAVDAEGGNVTG
ncbi:MAG: hypothetical protein A2358_02105 [Candidatus Staskawiczbacteria bacterium RIFOXYB1_FULL_37_44]|uniref:Glycoside hydrolase family 3 N-terminal domain-containing protein n=1 Tax=Candidatus Staskawiczbacteria bacterium RIFOXYB1_FULL_37_44 TaxID=1802223 RepID=A0A1G2ITN3_9BACT|nr:MAG: hypothetical protein A2358_02105 [Candidatus Staskawiczbacteria bacterium RIFOXYB1_FULL_37_44]OGZ82786.1 MAG: hypothetical protein A2416_03085 [Candidatus Staskawiczbacteria bacterium RIFOXYC1_FULL_37_52]OGZ87312.1 MAG: hypothetical protein A2444_02315 [Candidatus Staskawiczbacteria bacterium RIFOXYC2_FULL_37_19]OGZ90557.1 MAG: hypothetical protein A2581_02545 [Candidatus Staskawiczbacteria bacterium RIFOXYD1_FULL_37_110]